MIQVTSENNQLKVVTNGSVEYYSYEDIKSISPFHEKKFIAGKTPTISYVVVVNFINENKNSPLRLRLSQIDNQATWTNTQAGLEQAVADISSWISAIALGLATEATLQQIETNTTGTLKTPQYVVASNFAGTINVAVTSISFANNSSVDADITVDGVNYNVLPAGVTVNFDAGAIGNYYAANTFAYDTLSYPGSSIIIIYNEF